MVAGPDPFWVCGTQILRVGAKGGNLSACGHKMHVAGCTVAMTEGHGTGRYTSPASCRTADLKDLRQPRSDRRGGIGCEHS